MKPRWDSAELFLKVPAGQSITGFSMKIDTASCNTFSEDQQISGLWSCSIESGLSDDILGEHTVTVEETGELASDAGINPDKIEDILLYMTYKI
jgi:hypothetical protein